MITSKCELLCRIRMADLISNSQNVKPKMDILYEEWSEVRDSGMAMYTIAPSDELKTPV